jgi:hypothetical protein
MAMAKVNQERKTPDCYECIYRGDIPGDRHSKCTHPSSGYQENPISELLSLFGKKAGVIHNVNTPIRVVGNSHGIMSGWFNWPYNFDPVWLEKCDGFTDHES